MSLDRYQTLLKVAAGQPISTREAAARLRIPMSSASRLLASLVTRGVAQRLRPGLWVVGEELPDAFALASSLTAPAPAYISFTTALNHHGLIDQMPRQITVASTGRPRTIVTSRGEYVIHRIPPELFDGWSEDRGAWIARPEKALFDMAYVAAARGRSAFVPEMDLPSGFDARHFDAWLARVPSARLRTLTRRELGRLMTRAVR
jgi:predicted transcriptional regulator of viral defense system